MKKEAVRNEKITRAILRIRMDRPIEEDKHYLSPGGYYLKDKNGAEYPFDFLYSLGNIDSINNHCVDFEVCVADKEVFPNTDEIVQNLSNIVAFPECYIYTGEDEDPEIHPKKIESFTLEMYGEGKLETKNYPKNTPYLQFDVVNGVDNHILCCQFTRKLLDTCENFPNC